jgi:stress response protein SCP2
MNAQIQAMMIRRKSKVIVTNICEGSTPQGMVGAIIGNFGKLGYVMSADLVEALSACNYTELVAFHNEVFPILKEQVGMTNSYFRPMYPNFPTQVASASDEELWINAIMHYFGASIELRVMPEYKEEVRFPFCESREPRFLGLGTSQDAEAMFTEVLESKASPSVQDKADIDTIFTSGFTYLPATISNKEKLAYVCSKNLSFWGQLKTATDVLRVAVAMSNGDISLAKKTKFGKFPRVLRRNFLLTLDGMNQASVQEDMMRFEGMWIRLGEKLHPMEYCNKYPNIALSFSNLRNGNIQTTNSKIEKYLATGDFKRLVILLQDRPGDFARRLNAVLTNATDQMAVVTGFGDIVDKVSTPVLWQLLGYFSNRDMLMTFRNRIFLPKKPVALVSKNNLVALPNNVERRIIGMIERSLEDRYADAHFFAPLGKVYIDPICQSLLIPSGNRSASTALRQVAVGSRFPLPKDKDTVRLFVYWMDLKGDNGSGDRGYRYGSRVDLDLSAVMYDKDFNFLGQCSWTNLREGEGEDAVMCHSGDITSAPDGAAEYLDINLSKLGADVAYVACNIYNYTGQKMNELSVGTCGWMVREFPGSGEIFEALSVEGRCDLTADATATCPMIVDVAKREVVWTDLAMTLDGYCHSTETTTQKGIATAELATRMAYTKVSLYDLFFMHVLAREGKLVVNREDSDFAICEDGDLSPYDIAKICAEWL